MSMRYSIILALVACLHAAASHAADDYPFSLSLDDENTLTAVSEDDVLLGDVMEVLAETAGFKINAPADTDWNEALVRLDMKEKPLKKSIENLLRGWSHVIFTDEKTGALSSVMVFGREESAEGGTQVESSVSSVEALPPEEEMDPVDQAYYLLTNSSDTQQRVLAIESMPRYDNREDVRNLLGAVVIAEAGEAEQLAALEALRDTGVSDPDAIAAVRAMALDDGKPEMQRAALEVLYRYDESEAGRGVLHSLAVSGGPLGKIAQRELRRMALEAEARARQAEAKAKEKNNPQLQSDF